MYQGKKIVGFIPARGGSKGIIKKNICPVAGRPLVAWTISNALSSGTLDAVVVSTDDTEIADVARRWGAEVIHRPAELASDSAKTIDTVLHTLSVLGAQKRFFDYVMILQPTSPLRTAHDIDGCVEQAIQQNQHAVVSVHAVEEYPQFMRYMTDSSSQSLRNVIKGVSTIRRQDISPIFYVNGALYLYRTDILTTDTSLNDAPFGYIMPKERCVDINNSAEQKICEDLLSAR